MTLQKVEGKNQFKDSYSFGHNILRHFDVWQNFRVNTSETNLDC